MINQKAKQAFEEHKYVVVKNFLASNIANFLYYHAIHNDERLKTIKEVGDPLLVDKVFNEKGAIFKNYMMHRYGQDDDTQAPKAFSMYGDPAMDNLLLMSVKKAEEYTGLTLKPTYSYHRLYKKGNDLKPHIDRPSCEISATMCLGYDLSNLNDQYKDWNWPMYINDVPLHLEPGDIIFYRGCEVKHWREEFPGVNHAQVFLHYNEVGGNMETKAEEIGQDLLFDTRPFVGLPAYFKGIYKK